MATLHGNSRELMAGLVKAIERHPALSFVWRSGSHFEK
jgi:hypothetical protein